MRKYRHLLVALLLILVCFAYLAVRGRVLTVRILLPARSEVISRECSGDGVVRLLEEQWEDNTLLMTFEGVSPGKVDVNIRMKDDTNRYVRLYVHVFGIITENEILGYSTGSEIVPWTVTISALLLLADQIVTYRRQTAVNLYRYENIRCLGLIFFLIFLIFGQITYLFSYHSLLSTILSILSSAQFFSTILLPIAFVGSMIILVSNLKLMRREGKNWRNMLGTITGSLICAGTLFSLLLGEFLQRTTLVDVHNMNGIALYVEMLVEAAAFTVISYLECVLLGTIILAVRAAKRIPDFDRDYMLILGCMIREDGSLTPLLKGRADRALEFSGMQKAATGKELTFVPSGGQGSDEIMPEALAIRNYLIEQGVPEERILTEDRSVNTEENLRYSLELIRGDWKGKDEPKIAFSTTNYHVLRGGLFATQLGIAVQGIGSPTRSYFWINAFVREYIATLYYERKSHLKTILFLFLCILFMVLAARLSYNS